MYKKEITYIEMLILAYETEQRLAKPNYTLEDVYTSALRPLPDAFRPKPANDSSKPSA